MAGGRSNLVFIDFIKSEIASLRCNDALRAFFRKLLIISVKPIRPDIAPGAAESNRIALNTCTHFHGFPPSEPSLFYFSEVNFDGAGISFHSEPFRRKMQREEHSKKEPQSC